MNVQTILVPTDFSPDAEVALQAALDLAKVFGAKVELIHAYFVEVPAIYGGVSGEFLLPGNVMEPVRQAAEEAVAEYVKGLAEKGIQVEGRAIMGEAGGVILHEIEDTGADLVVMGTRGLTGLKHVLLGSTAERVVRMATCPVLTVKGEG